MTRVSVAVLAAIVLGAGVIAAPQTPQFRGGTHTVSIYATVIDADGRLVPDLSRDDFEVVEDGAPRALSLFANDIQPITIVIMLDRSGSMVGNFDLVRDATAQFVTDLLPADRARLGSFSTNIEIDPDAFTSDRTELLRILHDDLQPSGPTPLWNATSAAMNALGSQQGRRVVLVFTDGMDSPNSLGPNVTLADLRDRSQAEEIMVYGIGLADACGPAASHSTAAPGTIDAQRRGGPPRMPPRAPGRGPRGPMGLPPVMLPPKMPAPKPPPPIDGRDKGESDRGCKTIAPDPGLRELASVGGGGYFELQHTDDLRATFARVADELHHQYLLAFTTDRIDNKVHQLDVRVKRQDLSVRARHSYVAGR
jgi:VWFA-related protein